MATIDGNNSCHVDSSYLGSVKLWIVMPSIKIEDALDTTQNATTYSTHRHGTIHSDTVCFMWIVWRNLMTTTTTTTTTSGSCNTANPKQRTNEPTKQQK